MASFRVGLARGAYYVACIVSGFFFALACIATYVILTKGGNWHAVAGFAGFSVGFYVVGYAVRYLLIGK